MKRLSEEAKTWVEVLFLWAEWRCNGSNLPHLGGEAWKRADALGVPKRYAVASVALGTLAIVGYMAFASWRQPAAVDLFTTEAVAAALPDNVRPSSQPDVRVEITQPGADPVVVDPEGVTNLPLPSAIAHVEEQDANLGGAGADDQVAPAVIAEDGEGNGEGGVAGAGVTADFEQAGSPNSPVSTSTSPPGLPVSPSDSTTTTIATPITAPTTPTETPAPTLTVWCQLDVGTDSSVITWEALGATAVLRLNDEWYHTPADGALAVVVPELVALGDVFVLRLWQGSDSVDYPCVRGNGFATSPSTTSVPVTTSSTAPTTTATPALPAPIGVPAGPVQMGFSVDLWGQDRTNYWDDLETVPGNGRLIAHEFGSFTKPLNTSVLQWHMSQGRDVLYTWNGTDATDILSGQHDSYIRTRARDLAALPGTVMLRFWHEPDVQYKQSWIDGDPQQFIDSWMHVRELFVEEGAVSNIEWVWCPTAWRWAERGPNYYPGDDAVDWICADGYTGMDPSQSLTPIAEEFTEFHAWANQRHKPILIAEFGAGERGPGDRAAWVSSIDQWVTANPLIRAVVYFDIDKRPEEPWDWRIRTEADAWQALRDLLGSAPFGS